MNYLSQQIPLGKHSFRSAALALSAKGIRSASHGTDLCVAPELATVARKILDESAPSDPFNGPRHSPSGNLKGDDRHDDETEHDAGVDGLRKMVKDLEKRCDALEDENAELKRRGKRADQRQPDDENPKERERKAAAALAQTIRSKARVLGISTGDLCDQLNLSAADIRRFGFDDADMLPTQYAKAIGRVPPRTEPAIVDDGDSVSCSLMSPSEAQAIHDATQAQIGRLSR